jgi:hypothetical protein
MSSIWYFVQGLRSQALALSLIIVMMTTTTLTTAITIFSPPLVQSAFAEHGQEIVLTSKDTSFAPISSGEGNQVKVAVNYAVHDPMVANDLVKGVMRVYSPDGTLLKTSSSPNPFHINNIHGTVTLSTTLTDPTIDDVIAKIVFTNPIKTEIISNELPVSVNLIKDAAMTGEPKEGAISQVPQESKSKEEDEPLPEDKLPPTESTKTSSEVEGEQQSARIEEVPIIHQNPQVAPTESMPQTFTNSDVSPPPPPPPITPEPEICNDSIDNDGDTLIDLSDLDCNLIQTQQQQQPPAIQQQPAMVSSPEICNDDLDNDLDSKVDSRDEDCSSIISGTSSLSSPGEALSVAGEQTEENKDDDKEQQPEADLSEDAVEKEENDSGDNKDENSNEEENEDEDDDDEE